MITAYDRTIDGQGKSLRARLRWISSKNVLRQKVCSLDRLLAELKTDALGLEASRLECTILQKALSFGVSLRNCSSNCA